MKNVKLFSVCCFIAVLSSCESSKVATMKSTDADLDFYQSYAYFSNSDAVKNENEIAKNTTEVSSNVIKSIDRNMQNAGFEYNEENPDLLVLICATSNEGTQVDQGINSFAIASPANAMGPFYNPQFYTGPEIYPTAIAFNPNLDGYLEGTVVIQLIDKNTYETVWKGIATNDIYAKTSSYNLEILINNIFKEYPTRAKRTPEFNEGQEIARANIIRKM